MNTIQELLTVFKDLAIIGGIIGILVILYMIYRFVKLNLIQQKPQDDFEPGYNDFYYKKIVRRAKVDEERGFLKKYANIDENYRTTTFTQAIIQALKTSRLVEEIQLQKELLSINNEQMTASFELPEECPIPGEDECDIHDISDNQLELIDARNITYMADLFGIEHLEELCLCPDGRYCDWSGKMFEQFIVNTNEWDVQEISIYKCNPELDTATLIAYSDISDALISPLGGFAVVTMNEIDNMLTNLSGGDLIKAKFVWIDDSGRTRCIILRNIVPHEQTTDPGSGSSSLTAAKIDDKKG